MDGAGADRPNGSHRSISHALAAPAFQIGDADRAVCKLAPEGWFEAIAHHLIRAAQQRFGEAGGAACQVEVFLQIGIARERHPLMQLAEVAENLGELRFLQIEEAVRRSHLYSLRM